MANELPGLRTQKRTEATLNFRPYKWFLIAVAYYRVEDYKERIIKEYEARLRSSIFAPGIRTDAFLFPRFTIVLKILKSYEIGQTLTAAILLILSQYDPVVVGINLTKLLEASRLTRLFPPGFPTSLEIPKLPERLRHAPSVTLNPLANWSRSEAESRKLSTDRLENLRHFEVLPFQLHSVMTTKRATWNTARLRVETAYLDLATDIFGRCEAGLKSLAGSRIQIAKLQRETIASYKEKLLSYDIDGIVKDAYIREREEAAYETLTEIGTTSMRIAAVLCWLGFYDVVTVGLRLMKRAQPRLPSHHQHVLDRAWIVTPPTSDANDMDYDGILPIDPIIRQPASEKFKEVVVKKLQELGEISEEESQSGNQGLLGEVDLFQIPGATKDGIETTPRKEKTGETVDWTMVYIHYEDGLKATGERDIALLEHIDLREQAALNTLRVYGTSDRFTAQTLCFIAEQDIDVAGLRLTSSAKQFLSEENQHILNLDTPTEEQKPSSSLTLASMGRPFPIPPFQSSTSRFPKLQATRPANEMPFPLEVNRTPRARSLSLPRTWTATLRKPAPSIEQPSSLFINQPETPAEEQPTQSPRYDWGTPLLKSTEKGDSVLPFPHSAAPRTSSSTLSAPFLTNRLPSQPLSLRDPTLSAHLRTSSGNLTSPSLTNQLLNQPLSSPSPDPSLATHQLLTSTKMPVTATVKIQSAEKKGKKVETKAEELQVYNISPPQGIELLGESPYTGFPIDHPDDLLSDEWLYWVAVKIKGPARNTLWKNAFNAHGEPKFWGHGKAAIAPDQDGNLRYVIAYGGLILGGDRTGKTPLPKPGKLSTRLGGERLHMGVIAGQDYEIRAESSLQSRLRMQQQRADSVGTSTGSAGTKRSFDDFKGDELLIKDKGKGRATVPPPGAGILNQDFSDEESLGQPEKETSLALEESRLKLKNAEAMVTQQAQVIALMRRDFLRQQSLTVSTISRLTKATSAEERKLIFDNAKSSHNIVGAAAVKNIEEFLAKYPSLKVMDPKPTGTETHYGVAGFEFDSDFTDWLGDETISHIQESATPVKDEN